MSDRLRRRWRRYAVCSALSAALAVTALVVPIGDSAAYGLLLFVVLLLLFFSVGPAQADIALNDELDERGRTRWRIAVLVPGGIAVYWLLYIR